MRGKCQSDASGAQSPSLGIRFKIKMMMVFAAGIEARAASWALRSTLQIFIDGKFSSARSAEHSFAVPLRARPNGKFVARQFNVAIFAGVVNAAALHFDGDDIECAAVVPAAGLRVEINSADFGTCRHLIFSTHPIVRSSS